MPVGQKGKQPASLRLRVVQHEGSRVRNSTRGPGESPVGLFNFFGRKLVVNLPIESRLHPLFGHTSRSDKRSFLARKKLIRDRRVQLTWRALDHLGVVFPETLKHPFAKHIVTELALPGISA